MADKFTALANPAANLQIAIVVEQYVFDDCQAKAGAAGVLVAAGIGPVEAFRQARYMDRVNADTGVLHRQMGAFPVGGPGYADLTVCRRVLNRIEDQVRESAAQLAFIPFQ